MLPINYLAVLACGIVSMILGFVWYGPLFGKKYMQLQGMTQEQAAEHMKNPALRRKMMWNYVFTFVLALITAFVLAHALYYVSVYEDARGISIGLLVGIMIWLGFVVPATANLVFFDKKNWSWWFLVNGYYLIQLLLMGAILALWM
jgi:hypothetical protein